MHDDHFGPTKPGPIDYKCPVTGGTVHADNPEVEIHLIVGEGELERDIGLRLALFCTLKAFLAENRSWSMTLTPRARRRVHGHRGFDLGDDLVGFGFPALDEAIESHGLNNDAEPGSIRFNVGVNGLEHKIELAIPGDVLLQLIEDHGVSVERIPEDR